MKIAYIDPGLSCRKGHNAAMLEEFDQALAGERGHEIHYLVAAQTDKAEFTDLRGRLEPCFRIDGYAKPTQADLVEPARFDRIQAALAVDWASDRARAALADCDAILMPTAYPLHLHALAQGPATQWQDRRIVLGLLLPARFWNDGDLGERRLADMLAGSINTFAGAADLFAYSETGSYRFGDNTVPLATLLPPLARPSAQAVQQLAEQPVGSTDSFTLGFFGSPFTSKGFGLLAQAVQGLARETAPPAARLAIRLPAGHEAACAQLNALAPWIDAQSRRTSNAQYLAEMAAVDAVFAFYDPAEYGHKMSGIVPEAISLGKPLVVAEGCDAIQDFLERHAPGSFIGGPYRAETLTSLLQLQRGHWLRPSSCARRHAPLMQQMKSMERYLAVCGIA